MTQTTKELPNIRLLVLDVDGIWWSNFFAEIGSFLVSLLFLLGMRKKYRYF